MTYDFISEGQSDDPAEAEEVDGWRNVTDASVHNFHWFHGEPGDDDWLSITAGNKGLVGIEQEGWFIEVYPHPESGNTKRTLHDDRAEAMNRVFELMVKYP